jgi:hypothetical protein
MASGKTTKNTNTPENNAPEQDSPSLATPATPTASAPYERSPMLRPAGARTSSDITRKRGSGRGSEDSQEADYVNDQLNRVLYALDAFKPTTPWWR